jgi:MFS family permease
MLPFIRNDFNLDYTRAGLVVSVFSLAYGIGQLPAGWLADRIGTRILLASSICGVAAFGVLVGLSQSFVMLLVFLALMGVAGGGYHPSAPVAISAAVEPKNQGRALGFHLVGGSASFFLSPLIASAIAAVWGWRGSFIGLAIPSAIYGIAFYIILGRIGRAARSRGITTAQNAGSPAPAGWVKRVVIFTFLTVFPQAITFSAISFIPLFMVDNFAMSEESAAASLSIIYSAGLWASPLGGYLSDRFGKVPVVLVVCLLIGPIVYLITVVPYGAGFIALLLIMGVTMYIRMPASEAYIIGRSPEERRSTLLGIYYFAGIEGSAIFAPLMGYFIDKFGFNTAFGIAGGAVTAVVIICGLLLCGRD